MATILRHPVPSDSYVPDRPLNDLIAAQFQHFVEAAKRLPPELQARIPVPPADDPAAVGRFIAAVTKQLMSTRRKPLKLQPKRSRKPAAPVMALAAQADAPELDSSRDGPKAPSTSRSRKPSK